MEIITGHPAQFDVQVSGIPMPTLSWYRDRKEILPNEHFAIEFTEEDGFGSLIIKEVLSDDDAEYTCKATNKAGQAISKADLFLQPAHKKEPDEHPPLFITTLQKTTCIEGDSVNFVCKVFGTPEPDVTWYRNSVEIKLGPKVSMDYDESGMCTLLIRTVSMEDVATYSCKATNVAGEASTKGELIVEGKSAMVILRNQLNALCFSVAFSGDED